MTDFKGRAKRIEDVDLPRIGHQIGAGEDVIHAILDVESSGSGFDSKGRPKMLFEPHVFYRLLDGAQRTRAVNAGLAYPKWGEKRYPKDSYPRLAEAVKINREKALQAASWGLGQIMGFNHKAAGYATAADMVTAFMDDEDAHLEAMVSFIKTKHLDLHLRAMEKATTAAKRLEAAANFARGYNGSGFAKHNYHGRLVARYEWWRGKPDTPWSPKDAAAEDARHKASESAKADIPPMKHENIKTPTGTVPAAKPEPRKSFVATVIGIIIAAAAAAIAVISKKYGN